MIMQRTLLFVLLSLMALASYAQTATTFTYQGRLYNNGQLANGSYVLRIRPHSTLIGESPLAAALDTLALTVVDGIFSTTLDFGAGVFSGGPVFLDIQVQAPASSFVPLTPRQPVTPTPYAINADKLDGLDAAQIGSREFADFFALMFPDNAATVAPGTDVDFPQNGPQSGGITRLTADAFNLSAIGTYQVFFQVSITEPGQLLLTLNGADLAYTVVGRATGTSQVTGMALVQTTTINSILTVRNPAGNSTALTVTPLAGGTRLVSAHLVITRLQ
ncbi:MAG: hypothetical protein SGI99_00360 [Pseudomonadota bacterium]|nr:hypothetical protein [Pseudomonadota bacterium]